MVYIYFRIESLSKYYETNQKAFSEEEENKAKNIDLSNKDKEENLNQLNTKENPVTQKLISKTLYLIHKFLRGNKII